MLYFFKEEILNINFSYYFKEIKVVIILWYETFQREFVLLVILRISHNHRHSVTFHKYEKHEPWEKGNKNHYILE